MEERMVEQIVHHFLRLDLIDRAEGALLSDLTSRAAGERTCGVPQPSVFLINGRFQKLEEDQDQIRLDAGRDVEHTDEDFSNACKMAMSEPDPMKATALMDRQRHSAHRAIEHLEERLVLVQERRREREQKEEDERDFQASLRGSETDPRGFSRRKTRRPVTASDGG